MGKINGFFSYVLEREIMSLKENSNYTGYGSSNDETLRVANMINGGGYKWDGNTGVPEDIIFKGTPILKKGTNGKTHCSGFTFWVLIKTAGNLGLLNDKTAGQIQKLQRECYGSGTKGSETWWKQGQVATKNLGIGFPVEFKDAKKGDFAQIWRKNGSGHSVIFLDWVKKGNEIVGIKYRGSQPVTDGVGDRVEYTQGKSGIDLDHVYLWRLNPGNSSTTKIQTGVGVIEDPSSIVSSLPQKEVEIEDSKIYKEERGDPYEYKVVGGFWWTRGKSIKEWKCLKDNKKANEILDNRYPDARTKEEIKTNNLLYANE